MWLSFWRSRDRFSIEELRYLTEQLQKVQIINDVNKDFVVEALRSIAELLTYGDQHDPTFFDFFMEKEVMGEFVRILKISRTVTVSVQLLQTISIMIQNLKNEHAIYYMFSNEHINYLITYKFDFRNEELLSYYISFLRAISGKLDKNTISLVIKIQNDEVVSFPLYVEAIRFAFHEESMIRTAVRALTLNVYHVGDDCVNKFVSSAPHADYFINLVSFFRKQCLDLNGLMSDTLKSTDPNSTSAVHAAIDEIEDNLYYFSDVISAGIPDVGKSITDNILQRLILPLLLPSLHMDAADEMSIGAATSLYLLCCILRIVKIKDLANTIAAALFLPLEAFVPSSQVKLNGHVSSPTHTLETHQPENNNGEVDGACLSIGRPNLASSSQIHLQDVTQSSYSSSHPTLRETLLSYVTSGNDIQALGSLSILATLLQTKELDESMLDALGILPQRQQQKKLLLQSLVGEGSEEDQLFSSLSASMRDGINGELGGYLHKLKEDYGVFCSFPEVGMSPRVHKPQVLDALVSLLCRSNISAETLWDGGWLLRQLLPYGETEFKSCHLNLLKESYRRCGSVLLQETRGIWPDALMGVLSDEWKKCKRVIEASSPHKEPKSMLLRLQKSPFGDGFSGESSFTAGERMCELVKVFVLLHQLQFFSLGRALPEQPPIDPLTSTPKSSRAEATGLDVSGAKPGTEIKLVDAVPCRIAFERGKERHFLFLAISVSTSGWIVLADELPIKLNLGLVRVTAPLAGCNPQIDDKHLRWLHLRIRPSSLPFLDPAKRGAYGKLKTKALIDGRWTLAFRDEESCKSAYSMILEEMNLQSNAVERRLKPLLDLEKSIDHSNTSPYSKVISSTPITHTD